MIVIVGGTHSGSSEAKLSLMHRDGVGCVENAATNVEEDDAGYG